MAKIIAHRGYWVDPEERNSREAFERSLACGFGIETDIRDHAGRLVISHDPPGGGEPDLEELLQAYARHGGSAGPLALNIKADGLNAQLCRTLEAHRVTNCFAFDMSVPDCVAYATAGTRFFTRLSEYEAQPALYDQSSGIWVDLFESEWLDDQTLSAHLAAGKHVCVVSPELHGRDPEPAWAEWATWPSFADPATHVCTDHPERLSRLLPR